MLASVLAYASVIVCDAALEPAPPVGATMPVLPSRANASALPLLDATDTVGTTDSLSPLFGTPARFSSKPFRLIGVPAVQVPVPVVVVVPSLSDQS